MRGSLLNGLNTLPSYQQYFDLNTSTMALSTASTWIGNLVASIVCAKVPDYIGRKKTLVFGSLLSIIAVILQTASQNYAMIVTTRILLGLSAGTTSIAGPVYYPEALPPKWRGLSLCLIYWYGILILAQEICYTMLTDYRYVGGLIAAGVTYATASMDSSWAWRLPTALQGVFTLLILILLPFITESPRWLAFASREEESRQALAYIYTNGNIDDPVVHT
jgi:MFS family permease